MASAPRQAVPPKLTLATGDFQYDCYASAGTVPFLVQVFDGAGSAAFSAFSVDGQAAAITTPIQVNLAAGSKPVLRFVVAFSDPGATAVICEACTPPQKLKLVDAQHPLAEIRIKVS